MGFSPADVDQMSPWAFLACLDGYGRAQGWDMKPQGQPMTSDRLRELGIEGF